MCENNDPSKSTEVKTYRKMPVTFQDLIKDGFHNFIDTSCCIKNVYCLSSIEGYVPRSNMSYVYDTSERQLYVMGGYITDEQNELINTEGIQHKQMVIHSLNADTHLWQTIPSQDYPISYELTDSVHKRVLFQNAFVQRYGQRSAMFERKIFLYGGTTRPTPDRMSDLALVECFDLETRTWSIPGLKGYIPNATMCHASTYRGSDWFIHGGFLCGLYFGQFSNSLYHYDMSNNTMSLVRAVDSQHIIDDLFMDCHSLVLIGHCLYLFGGRLRSKAGSNNRVSDKLYCFNLVSNKWSLIQNVGACPDARRGHTATSYNQFMILFGGCNVSSLHHYNDCHFFDTSVSQWYAINILGLRARPRRSHGCVLTDNSLIIFGGTAPKYEAKNNSELLLLSFNGSEDCALDDISDTIIIEIFPKLKQRCIHVIVDNKIDFRKHLPKHMVNTVEEFILSMQQEKNYVY